MKTALCISLFFAAISGIRLRQCIKAGDRKDGNIEGFGVFIYAPMFGVLCVLSLIFLVLALLGV